MGQLFSLGLGGLFRSSFDSFKFSPNSLGVVSLFTWRKDFLFLVLSVLASSLGTLFRGPFFARIASLLRGGPYFHVLSILFLKQGPRISPFPEFLAQGAFLLPLSNFVGLGAKEPLLSTILGGYVVRSNSSF